MAKTFGFIIQMPINVTFQDEEFAEIEREVAERRASAVASHMPETAIAAISVERVALERAEECARNALHVGMTQHAGALIVVESREPLHV